MTLTVDQAEALFFLAASVPDPAPEEHAALAHLGQLVGIDPDLLAPPTWQLRGWPEVPEGGEGGST